VHWRHVLFDEIEKAHPRLLDKFLQVLDDGVLTSGRGERVYFSESFIVFTSNLGIYRVVPGGEREPNVLASEPFEAVRQKVRSEIDRHFKLELGRPEILNRIGENVIVFDFIREDVAEEIFASMLGGLVESVRATQRLDVYVVETALSELRSLCLSDLSNGGRGIRNQLEAHFVNPLARALFDAEVGPGARMEIYDVKRGPVTTLDWRIIERGQPP
jgi:ATP-dependent Clp protease ATP-binding subunit ClpA